MFGTLHPELVLFSLFTRYVLLYTKRSMLPCGPVSIGRSLFAASVITGRNICAPFDAFESNWSEADSSLGSMDVLDGDRIRETIKYHKAKKKINGLHEDVLYGRAAHITPLR